MRLIKLFLALIFSININNVFGIVLNGQGSSLLNPLIQAIITNYQAANPHAALFTYTSTNSTAGLNALIAGQVVYAGSDVPPTDAQEAAENNTLLTFPVAVAGVALGFRLDGYAPAELRLTAQNLADIFRGAITSWNDSRLVVNNPTLSGFPVTITPIVRSDSSGTTNDFTTFLSLSNVTPPWPASLTGSGPFTPAQWGNPNIVAASGNSGVANAIKNTNGSLGYLGFDIAEENSIDTAALQNSSGNFILPSTASFTAAATLTTVPTDLRIRTINTSDPSGYPIASPTNVVVFQNQPTNCFVQNLVQFLNYIATTGQTIAPTLFFGPLPSNIISQFLINIGLITSTSQGDALTDAIIQKYGS